MNQCARTNQTLHPDGIIWTVKLFWIVMWGSKSSTLAKIKKKNKDVEKHCSQLFKLEKSSKKRPTILTPFLHRLYSRLTFTIRQFLAIFNLMEPFVSNMNIRISRLLRSSVLLRKVFTVLFALIYIIIRVEKTLFVALDSHAVSCAQQWANWWVQFKQ